MSASGTAWPKQSTMIFRRLRLRDYSADNGLAKATYTAFTHEQAAQMFAADYPWAIRCAPSNTVHVWQLDQPVERQKGVSV